MLKSLAVMSLPWDVAVERGWDTHVSVFATGTDLVEFGPLPAQNTGRKAPGLPHSKAEGMAAISSSRFRACDFSRRVVYVVVAMV